MGCLNNFGSVDADEISGYNNASVSDASEEYIVSPIIEENFENDGENGEYELLPLITEENYKDYGFSDANYTKYLNYFPIANLRDLFLLRDAVEQKGAYSMPEVNSYNPKCNAVLINDIVFNNQIIGEGNNIIENNIINRWIPIANYEGLFDGQFYSIYGLYIDQPYYSENDKKYNYGFIAKCKGSIVNLNIKDSCINCIAEDGMLLGNISVGTFTVDLEKSGNDLGVIDNCTFSGQINASVHSADVYIAGIVNKCIGGKVLNCTNYADININNNGATRNDYKYCTSGICLKCEENQQDSCLIEKCVNNGNLHGDEVYGVISDCKNTTIKDSGNTGTLSGTKEAAGFSCSCTGTFSISNCYNNGDVISEDGDVSGFISRCESDNGNNGEKIIENCYNKGDLYGKQAAGFVNRIDGNSKLKIMNCYNSGNVTSVGPNKASSGFVNVSNNDYAWFINCYNEGDVNTQSGFNAQGFAENTRGYIYGCYNLGDVSTSDMSSLKSDSDYPSGFIGTCYAFLVSCYNMGKVIAPNNYGMNDYAGFIYNYAPKKYELDNCYCVKYEQKDICVGSASFLTSLDVESFYSGEVTYKLNSIIKENSQEDFEWFYGVSPSDALFYQNIDNNDKNFPTHNEEDGVVYYVDCFKCDGITKTKMYSNYDDDNYVQPHKIVKDDAVEPTCSSTGLSEGSHCSECNKIIIEQAIIPATGHDFDEWELLDAEDYKYRHKCKVCGLEEVVVHHLDGGTIIEPPDCLNGGVTKYNCTDCDETFIVNTDPLGHDYGGYIKNDKGSHYRKCSRCKLIVLSGHKWDSGSVLEEATTEKAGMVKYTCLDCGYEKEEVVPVIKDGWIKEQDGWYFYIMGELYSDDNYNMAKGTIEGTTTWFFVDNGWFDSSYTGFAKNANGWWFMKNGVLDKTTGLVKGRVGEELDTYYVKNGSVKLTTNGFVKNGSDWIYISKGVLNKNTTPMNGTINGKKSWYYVKSGKVDFSYKGFAKCGSSWMYFENGTINKNINGAVNGTINGTKTWYYVKNGKYISTFKGIVKIGSSQMYFDKGIVDKKYSGKFKYNGKTYTIKKGKVTNVK